jgi:hypothetical protein
LAGFPVVDAKYYIREQQYISVLNEKTLALREHGEGLLSRMISGASDRYPYS